LSLPDLVGGAGQEGGRLVADHYEIQRRIGIGGMGEVFFAQDRKLDRPVAIKAIRHERLKDGRSRMRFVREARVASSIVHPYVATVFDVVQDGDDVLLVMEYIEGRSLDRVLEDPAVPIESRLRYGVEIAEALVAIHKQGLVHRDLKPGNVIITGSDHVKVLDFGVAEEVVVPSLLDPTRTASSLTGEGMVVGTIAYMSPEQLRGQEVDARSDVFSFGVLLHQLVTRRHPFLRPTQAETISAILHDPPAAAEEFSTLTGSPMLQRLMLRALEKDRALRYPSATALAEELGAGIRSASDLRAAVTATRLKRRVVLGASAVVLTAIVLSLGFVQLMRTPPAWDRPRAAIAVLPFLDKTGSADGKVRSEMVSDLLAIDLQSSRLIRAIGPDETGPILAGAAAGQLGDALANRVASAVRADYVLMGTLYEEAGRYRATATVYSVPASGPALSALSVDAETASGVAEALASALRRDLPGVSRLTAARDDRVDLTEITSTSDEARLLYERGRTALRDGKLSESIRLLEGAVKQDSRFALAQSALAQALYSAGYSRRAREAADKAVALAPDSGSPAVMRLALTLRASWANVYERHDELLEAATKLANAYPDEPEMVAQLAGALAAVGKKAEALGAIDRAIHLDPARPALHLQKAAILGSMERYDDASGALSEAERLYGLLESDEGLAATAQRRGRLLLDRQDLAEALRSFDTAVSMYERAQQEPLSAAALLEAASAELVAGSVERADERLSRAEAIARETGNSRLLCSALSTQGAQQFVRGEFAKADATLRDAVDLARQLEDDELLLEPLSNLASLHSYTGKLQDAKLELEDVVARSKAEGREDFENNARLLLSDVQYQLGDIEQAIAIDRELAAATDNPGTRIGVAHALHHLGEVYESRGRLQDSLAALDQAAAKFESLGAARDRAYVLVWRAQVKGALGRSAEAKADLADAERLAKDPKLGLGDLAIRCMLARAWLLVFQEQSPQAMNLAKAALRRPEAGGPPLSVYASNVLCNASIESGRFEDAMKVCGGLARSPSTWASIRVASAASLAEGLLRSGEPAKARDEAQQALARAQSMALLLPTARAAAVICSLPPSLRPGDVDRVRESGLGALEAYAQSAPTVDAQALQRRSDLRRMRAALERSR
jgi:tetratricopeptide (TPR) repeat protein/TolB-like protein/predicted Ser/Thr protein kinase